MGSRAGASCRVDLRRHRLRPGAPTRARRPSGVRSPDQLSQGHLKLAASWSRSRARPSPTFTLPPSGSRSAMCTAPAKPRRSPCRRCRAPHTVVGVLLHHLGQGLDPARRQNRSTLRWTGRPSRPTSGGIGIEGARAFTAAGTTSRYYFPWSRSPFWVCSTRSLTAPGGCADLPQLFPDIDHGTSPSARPIWVNLRRCRAPRMRSPWLMGLYTATAMPTLARSAKSR